MNPKVLQRPPASQSAVDQEFRADLAKREAALKNKESQYNIDTLAQIVAGKSKAPRRVADYIKVSRAERGAETPTGLRF